MRLPSFEIAIEFGRQPIGEFGYGEVEIVSTTALEFREMTERLSEPEFATKTSPSPFNCRSRGCFPTRVDPINAPLNV
jgi:hypothetical protein